MKTGICYLGGDEWSVAEEGFHPERARVSESNFSLANEFMGVRGYFEEGYTGDHLQGSYFGGLYENKEIGHPQVFKGLLKSENFIVNSVDWLYTRIALDGEPLDLDKVKYADFVRRLDMKAGTLTRSYVWETASGKKLNVQFERFLSMDNERLACQRITFTPLNFSGDVNVSLGLNFETIHEIAGGWEANIITGADKGRGKTYWEVLKKERINGLCAISARTRTTKFTVFSSFRWAANVDCANTPVQRDAFIGVDLVVPCTEGKDAVIEKTVVNDWERPACLTPDQVWERGLKHAAACAATTYETALAPHTAYWAHRWEKADITIEGDRELQQGMRFDLFHFHMAYQGRDDRLSIASKGLTAEVYSGWTFWVVESYCQHVIIFTDPAMARKLLHFRWLCLPAAIERAEQVDCRGARYPFCTIDGPESCATWQHADMEIHVGEAIYRAIELYAMHTGDTEFLYSEGIEMLLQMSRYYASRGGYSPARGDFGFYGVMGPDEYHTVVNNNYYTNYMGKKLFEYTLKVAAKMKEDAPAEWEAVSKKVSLESSELSDWADMAAKMRLPMDEKTGVCEQHDGYFDLPDADVPNIGEEQIPIYKTWAYERILRMNMVKQADVILLPLWFSKEWSDEATRTQYEYYEPRTIHESSFSPSIHQILAAELGKPDHADYFFRQMARLDLDDHNRNTAQGIHLTPKSGTWMCMVYGYGGMRTDAPVLSFQPTIPKKWKSYSFNITHRGSWLKVTVTQDAAEFRVVEGGDLEIDVYGKKLTTTAAGMKVPLEAPAAARIAELV